MDFPDAVHVFVSKYACRVFWYLFSLFDYVIDQLL